MPARGLRRMALIAGLAWLWAAPVVASSDLCEAAATRAARETGVSLALLRAIMLAESGQDRGAGRAPWPWTVQSDGKGHWLSSAEEVLTLVDNLTADGSTNVDIGCFQINLRWHGAAFSSVAAMTDPDANALYAAQYLLELRQQTGDWRSAAGAYHSRSAGRAETYVARLIAMNAETRAAESAGGPARPVPARSLPARSLPDTVVPDRVMALSPDPGRRALRGQAQGPILRLGALSAPLVGGLR